MLFFRIAAVLCEDLHACSAKAFLNIWQIEGLNTELPQQYMTTLHHA